MENRINQDNERLMRRLKELGISVTNIAERFGIAESSVYYHLNEETRKKTKVRTKEYQRKNFEKVKKYNDNWKKENPDKFKRSICLGVVRHNLRAGRINTDDLKAIISEWELNKCKKRSGF